jgi:F-type H+-transporting ATPase subunit a
MSSPVLHVKDCFFFEVPRAWYQPHYESASDVPEYILRDYLHLPEDAKVSPEQKQSIDKADLDSISQAMAGKILIPQFPFTELKNLYEVKWGLGISKYMIIELLVAVIVFAAFYWLKKAFFRSDAPRGRVRNMLEAMVAFVRDQLARPSLGKEDADTFVPFLLTAFLFILTANLIGMLPFMGTITGDLHVTAGLALCTFVIGTYYGVQRMGWKGWISNFIPHIDLPPVLAPLKYMIFLIEVFGTLIKHVVLAIRLFANMMAGHMVLAGILGAVVVAAELMESGTSSWQWYAGAPLAVIGSGLFSMLEFLVAFLQAYVFTLLSAMFISSSIHSHHPHTEHDHGHGHEHAHAH